MEDKTPIYLMVIVGIVGIVAIFSIILKNASYTGNVQTVEDAPNDMLTGNVVLEESEPIDLGSIGKFLFGATLLGICGYMYFKTE